MAKLKKSGIIIDMDTKTQNKWMILASLASLATALFFIVLKGIAFVATGSVAILSSLFDSVQDFMTSSINAIAIRQAVLPADKHHRFGHGKAQGVGSLIQACIITMAAIFLLKESIQRLISVEPVHDIEIGIFVSIIAVIVTFGLTFLQGWVIRQTNSLCIKTDRAHYTGDILMNIGVLLSLMLSYYFNWMWLDGVFGIGVALYLFYAMSSVIQEALAMLMDKELPENIRNKIKSVALSTPEVLNVSDLKTRESGSHIFIQLNVQFDGKIQLDHAHQRIDEIENNLHILYPESEVIIHPEPFIQQKKTRRVK